MKEQTEHTAWIAAYIAGESITSISARLSVPFWRVRNAVLWSDALAAYSEKRYKKYWSTVREHLRKFPDEVAHNNTIGVDPKAYRMIRYALIVRGEIPNVTRYKRRVSIQEETRITQLTSTPGSWRKLHQLAKTTGRKGGQQAYIAARVMGERMIHYRRNSGLSLRGIEDATGIPFGSIRRYFNLGILKLPFDEKQFIGLLAAGLVMYHCANYLVPHYHEIAAYYRNEYRRKYISLKYCAEIVFTNQNGVSHVMKHNGIPRELVIYPKSRLFAYDRERVAAYYQKRLTRHIANQIREYPNDWQHLQCDWYKWG
jgi:hypothetical protein